MQENTCMYDQLFNGKFLWREYRVYKNHVHIHVYIFCGDIDYGV